MGMKLVSAIVPGDVVVESMGARRVMDVEERVTGFVREVVLHYADGGSMPYVRSAMVVLGTSRPTDRATDLLRELEGHVHADQLETLDLAPIERMLGLLIEGLEQV